MPTEKAESHRDAAEDPAESDETGAPRHTADERTKRVLEDADELVEMVDELLFGEIKDETARDRYAEDTTRAFVQKGGQ